MRDLDLISLLQYYTTETTRWPLNMYLSIFVYLRDNTGQVLTLRFY
jgi:hypothetical protein